MGASILVSCGPIKRYLFSGLSSVRLDNRYVHRLLFEEKEDKITLKLIEIDDTHYGNKK